jgi:glutathione S-transferase
LFFGPGCLEPALIDKMSAREPVPAQMMGYGDFATTFAVVAHAVARGTYLLGEQFTAANIVIGSGLRWGMMTGAIPQRPEFMAYTGRLAARPALQRAEAKDVELAATMAGS